MLCTRIKLVARMYIKAPLCSKFAMYTHSGASGWQTFQTTAAIKKIGTVLKILLIIILVYSMCSNYFSIFFKVV